MNRGILAWLIGCVSFPLFVGYTTLGSVSHSSLALLLTILAGFPIMLVALLVSFWRTKTPPMRTVLILGSSALLFMALLWVGQAFGQVLQRYEIEKAKAYPPRIESAFDAWHKEHGKYPDRLALIEAIPPPPRLLAYWSNGEVCIFSCEDPSRPFACWLYDTTSRTWSYKPD